MTTQAPLQRKRLRDSAILGIVLLTLVCMRQVQLSSNVASLKVSSLDTKENRFDSSVNAAIASLQELSKTTTSSSSSGSQTNSSESLMEAPQKCRAGWPLKSRCTRRLPNPSFVQNTASANNNDICSTEHRLSDREANSSTLLLQAIYIHRALDEDCWETPSYIYVKHADAQDHLLAPSSIVATEPERAAQLKEKCQLPLIFPRSLFLYGMCGLWLTKTTDYYFAGQIGKYRHWVQEYAHRNHSTIQSAPRGRTILKQTGHYDYAYYDQLKAARFALAPDGDYHWSYRFLEAILCGAIPVLQLDEVAVTDANRTQAESSVWIRAFSDPTTNTMRYFQLTEQEIGYEFCMHGILCPLESDEAARQQAALSNWRRLVRRHSLMVETGNEDFLL